MPSWLFLFFYIFYFVLILFSRYRQMASAILLGKFRFLWDDLRQIKFPHKNFLKIPLLSVMDGDFFTKNFIENLHFY